MNIRKLVKRIIPVGLFVTIEPYGHLAEAVLFNALNGFPSRGLKVIGVTGTNGKTTTSFLIHRMLVEAGYNAGLMTTVAYGVGKNIKPQVEHMTSVDVPTLMKRMKEMKRQGADYVVLETTSHALAQHRVWGVPYSVAVLTNLTHEHLDYHKTFERYRDAKRMMFKKADRNRKGLRAGVINVDDENARFFAGDIKYPLLYGIKDGDLRAENVKLGSDGVEYDVKTGGEALHITTHLPGSFNVYNSLAAVGVGQLLGLSGEQIERGIAALTGVEGRMMHIDEGQDFDVIVDYAHTPDSFEKLFKDLKPVVKGKLIVMFGSAGRRDEAKRDVQGGLAGKYADEVVVTEEDDRDMDGQEIMEQIAAGAEKAGKTRDKDLFLVHDRAEAIGFTIKRAGKDDVVMLLGKGHEKDILRNGPRAAELRHMQQDDHNPERVREDPWDEVATVRAALKQ
ncbi:MAG TPA: UDP-N-acetylmuramoyl-L-alanyl-D-glutamate--2,6-diaminopimelate ligase [Candidatus Saccharimonadales bacterium]|nr:UDP-N-acetylmuramoyl-L-alanyl-D-glutamate--2,6-diaminopimelate ligase [Candidatus Saccharimonadales bacterium]